MNLKNELINTFKRYDFLLNILLILSILFTILCFYSDVKNTLSHGSMDLRNRVVGARVFKYTNRNPYTFRWGKNTNEKFVDPFDNLVGFKANRVTVTPFALWFHSLLCKLPYTTQQILWNGFMWLLAVFSLLMLISKTGGLKRKIIIIVVLFGIFSSYFFRLHIDKGQIYILYLFLFTIFYHFYKSDKKLLSSIFAGLLIAFRPTAILILFPFVFKKKFAFIFLIFIFSLFFTIVPVFRHGVEIYKMYFKAMKRHELLHINKIKVGYDEYPAKSEIDGVKNLKSDGNYPLKDSSLQWLFLKYLHLKVNSHVLILLMLILFFPILYNFYLIKDLADIDLIFLVSFALFYMADYFLPAARLSYANVFWIFPVIIFLKNGDKDFYFGLPFLLLIFSFFLNLFYYLNDVVLVISDYVFLAFIITSLFYFFKKNSAQ